MVQHLNEMKDYIRIAGDSFSFNEESERENILETDDISSVSSILIEELNDIVFKLRSYRELSEDQSYALGVEEGLSLAAEMLMRSIERYDNK